MLKRVQAESRMQTEAKTDGLTDKEQPCTERTQFLSTREAQVRGREAQELIFNQSNEEE